MNNQSSPRPGHRAALKWYADLDLRVAALEKSKGVTGYAVDSRLREAFNALPLEQRGAFLDAIGAYIMTWKTIGEPTTTYSVDDELLRTYALSPDEQDAYYDATGVGHG